MTALLLTPPGAAAIAVVRITGESVPSFLAEQFSATCHLGRAVHGDLQDGDRVIDDPVIVLVNELTADINLHGGPWVVRATLELLARHGFVLQEAKPDAPLPPEAIDADDPIWQEVLADLPRAKTELGVRMLLAQPAAWEQLATDRPSEQAVHAMLADRTMERMLNPARVAIVGPANAGKSTLANRLFGQERSITADLPGTTRDWVGHLANLDGVPVMLVDTPGLRESDDTIEQAAIATARRQIAGADVVVTLLDATRPIDAEQQAAISQHPGAIVALNKTDASSPDSGLEWAAIAVSARTGVGVDTLIEAIHQRLSCDDPAIEQPRCWTMRQRQHLRELCID